MYLLVFRTHSAPGFQKDRNGELFVAGIITHIAKPDNHKNRYHTVPYRPLIRSRKPPETQQQPYIVTMKLDVLALVCHVGAVAAFQHRFQSTTCVTPASSLRLSSSTDENPSMEGKTVYKRTLFRLQPSPDLSIHNALVIEERLRYRPSPDDPTFMEPFGPRTLLLRDGQVKEGAIGDDFCTINVHEVPPTTKPTTSPSSSSSSNTLQHGGRPAAVDESIILGLVLAAQPDICQGPVLEIAAREGLGALMGCMGAAVASKTPQERAAVVSAAQDDDKDDVLTVPTNHITERLMPGRLTSLTITDSDPVMLDLCAAQVTGLLGGESGSPSSKVHVQALDWRARPLPMARGSSSSRNSRREYATVVLADGPLTFPETREMVRTVAHRVGPSDPSLARLLFKDDDEDNDKSNSVPIPRFVHVSRDGREETVYMRKYLSEGCRMSVSTAYVTVEKIAFAIQSIDTVPPSEEGALLDPLELEVARVDELDYQIVTATHDLSYTGGGSGEVFFPMEASDFSVGGRGGQSTGLEPERGGFLG